MLFSKKNFALPVWVPSRSYESHWRGQPPRSPTCPYIGCNWCRQDFTDSGIFSTNFIFLYWKHLSCPLDIFSLSFLQISFSLNLLYNSWIWCLFSFTHRKTLNRQLSEEIKITIIFSILSLALFQFLFLLFLSSLDFTVCRDISKFSGIFDLFILRLYCSISTLHFFSAALFRHSGSESRKNSRKLKPEPLNRRSLSQPPASAIF